MPGNTIGEGHGDGLDDYWNKWGGGLRMRKRWGRDGKRGRGYGERDATCDVGL